MSTSTWAPSSAFSMLFIGSCRNLRTVSEGLLLGAPRAIFREIRQLNGSWGHWDRLEMLFNLFCFGPYLTWIRALHSGITSGGAEGLFGVWFGMPVMNHSAHCTFSLASGLIYSTCTLIPRWGGDVLCVWREWRAELFCCGPKLHGDPLRFLPPICLKFEKSLVRHVCKSFLHLFLQLKYYRPMKSHFK